MKNNLRTEQVEELVSAIKPLSPKRDQYQSSPDKSLFHGFSTFDMDKIGKICRHHWNERLNIIITAKFEGDTYRIYSINRPGRLLNFWTLRVGAYSRWAIIRG